MTLPLGLPELMMGFTADGQINPALVNDRDQRFNISTEAKKQNRADISAPRVQPGADAWETGQISSVATSIVPLSSRNHR